MCRRVVDQVCIGRYGHNQRTGDESLEEDEKDGGRDGARVLCENIQSGKVYLEKDEVALLE